MAQHPPSPARVALGLVIAALQRAEADAVTPEAIDQHAAALRVVRGSGAFVTPNGEPVADVLAALVAAIPTPGTQKATEPFFAALEVANRPAYRFAAGSADLASGALLSETHTGRQVYFQPGDDAEAARETFGKSGAGGFVTLEGEGVAHAWAPLASEYFDGKES